MDELFDGWTLHFWTMKVGQMLKHIQMQDLSDFFKTLSERESKGVFFYRINGYSQ